jgi:hypothetical protein
MAHGTQQTATAAEQSTRASDHLSEQAEAARQHAADLTKIVNGASRRGPAPATTPPGSTRSTTTNLLTKVGSWLGSRKAA